jgi:hypothetical protein
MDTRKLHGSGLTVIPLAERQAKIDAAQGRPTSYGGSQLTTIPLAERQAIIAINCQINIYTVCQSKFVIIMSKI